MNTPVEASSVAPTGGVVGKLKVKVWGGESGSVTVLVIVSVAP